MGDSLVGSGGPPYFSGAPSFNSSDNSIYLSFSDGMLDTSVDSSVLKDRFSISTYEWGGPISNNAISSVLVDMYGVNIYLSHSDLSSYSYQNLYVTYNEPSGDVSSESCKEIMEST